MTIVRKNNLNHKIKNIYIAVDGYIKKNRKKKMKCTI